MYYNSVFPRVRTNQDVLTGTFYSLINLNSMNERRNTKIISKKILYGRYPNVVESIFRVESPEDTTYKNRTEILNDC